MDDSSVFEKHVFKEMAYYHPYVADRIEKYSFNVPLGELTLKLDDGSTMLYDFFHQSMRRLPSDSTKMTEEECKREFGLKLQKMIYAKGMTQKKLSEISGITEASISMYIKGRAMPTFYTLDKIAKALKCSVDDLRYVDF